MRLSLQSKVLRYSIYTFVSVAFLLVFSTSTSPLCDAYGFDSAFFTLVGRGMKDGLLPYRDFFDMKGPYLFFFEYLGQLLHTGRTGSFILQSVNLSACLWVVDSIYTSELKLFILDSFKGFIKLFFIGFVPVLGIAAFTFERGNLTEELSLLFLLLSLKFMLTYFRKADTNKNLPHPPGYGFCYGAFFGVLSLIRITNAALIGAVVLTVAIELICSKQFKNLILNGLMFIAGICAAFAPMVVYFYAKGLLTEMLYQVFAFGFTYSSEFTFAQKLLQTLSAHWAVVLAMLFPVFSAFLLSPKNRKHCVFAVSSFVLLLVGVSMGNGYLHYFTLGLPNIVFGLFLVLKAENLPLVSKAKKWVLGTVCVALTLLQLPNLTIAGGACVSRILDLKNDQTCEQVLEIKSHIPKEDYHRIYAYTKTSCSAWYAIAETYPPNRYCDWQDHYMSLSPQIKEEILDYFEDSDSAPVWLVTSVSRPIETKEINEIIDTQYTLHTENEMFRLFKRK